VLLVGFMIRIYHDARSPDRQSFKVLINIRQTSHVFDMEKLKTLHVSALNEAIIKLYNISYRRCNIQH